MTSSHRLIPTFGRKRSRRASDKRTETLENLLPSLQITLPENGLIDLKALFPSSSEIVLEIGFGAGEHLVAQALHNPKSGYLGCEVYQDGIARALKQIEDEDLMNVKIFPGDGRLLVDKIPAASISRVFILFPDPWPKMRHHKRRIIAPATLGALAHIMKPGAQLRIATDHMEYARWMLINLLNHPDFTWQASSAEDWLNPPPDHFTTRYETKRKTGAQPLFFNFLRN